MVFTIYGRPSWSCDLDFAIKLSFPYPWLLHIKFDFDWPSGFREEDFEKCVWMTDRPRSRDDLDLN